VRFTVANRSTSSASNRDLLGMASPHKSDVAGIRSNDGSRPPLHAAILIDFSFLGAYLENSYNLRIGALQFLALALDTQMPTKNRPIGKQSLQGGEACRSSNW
jgi:hypothetical protein